MSSSRPTSWLPIAALLVGVAGALGWLLLGFAADRTGRVALPDPASGATVEILTGQQRNVPRAELEQQPATAWKAHRGGGYIVGRPEVELWLRVTLRNPTDVAWQGVLDTGDYFADRAEVWAEGRSGPPLRSGEKVASRERALPGREVAFPVSVPARSERVVYWRIENRFGAVVAPAWWARQADFHAAQGRGLLAEGLYLGGLFALLGYNTLLWLRLRQADIGCYILYLGNVALFMGLARGFLPGPGWPLGSPAVEALVAATMALSGFFLVQFARVFMELPARLPRGDGVARGLGVLLLVPVAGALTMPWLGRGNWMLPAVFAVGVAHVTLLVLALLAWRAGVRQARFFVLSFGCLFAGSLPAAAIWFATVPEKDLAMLGLMIGSALEMLLLSLAVADRFAQAQRERVAAQAGLIEETERRRAVEEAYADELAVEVRERTRELEAANADKDRMLTVLGHDLRSPLTGLTQAAEQLVAEPADVTALGKFAGDAATMGRQVLLLIEDLVLWARLRAGHAPPPGRHQARAIVAPVIALHRAFAGQRGIALTVAVPEDLRVATDLVLAQTLLRNLVANALKFARQQVAVSAERSAGGVQLTVRDDGPGLPPAVLAGLAGAAPGAGTMMDGGLGLRLCVEIGRALGTKLAAGPAPGGGAEFNFVLLAADEAKTP